jgi:hypothetical protein
MLMQGKFWLHQEEGIDNAGPTDVYFSLLDPTGYRARKALCRRVENLFLRADSECTKVLARSP